MAAATANGGDDSVRCVRERVTEERTRARESAREVGVAAWRLRGIQTRRGEGRQAEREVAWRGGARARRARAHPPVREEDDRGGASGLGRRWLLLGCTGRRPR